jgi:TonB-dependent receptor
MAKFPELNLAESLQRLPGVQINREAGEGRRISLRGLGPDFARVQLNGMEVLGNVDSAQDSRGQRSRDRAFDFNIFASELFSRVEVEKTFQAAQNEGGMAGTVGLFTGKPFDYAPGAKGALSLKLGTNEYTKDTQPRVAALFSHNWDNRFGVAGLGRLFQAQDHRAGPQHLQLRPARRGHDEVAGRQGSGHLQAERRAAGQVPVRRPVSSPTATAFRPGTPSRSAWA